MSKCCRRDNRSCTKGSKVNCKGPVLVQTQIRKEGRETCWCGVKAVFENRGVLGARTLPVANLFQASSACTTSSWVLLLLMVHWRPSTACTIGSLFTFGHCQHLVVVSQDFKSLNGPQKDNTARKPGICPRRGGSDLHQMWRGSLKSTEIEDQPSLSYVHTCTQAHKHLFAGRQQTSRWYHVDVSVFFQVFSCCLRSESCSCSRLEFKYDCKIVDGLVLIIDTEMASDTEDQELPHFNSLWWMNLCFSHFPTRTVLISTLSVFVLDW